MIPAMRGLSVLILDVMAAWPRNELIFRVIYPMANNMPPRLQALDIPYSYALQELCRMGAATIMRKVPLAHG